MQVATREGEIKALSDVLFKKEGDFTVALLFQVEDNGSAAQFSLRQDVFHFLQVLVLQRDFEKVVCVVDRENLDFTLSSEGVDLVS